MSYGDYPDLSGVRRVLVIKLRHLGDVLLTTPVFSVLQRALPEAVIDAYVYKDCAPMLHGHPAVKEIISYDRSWKKWGLMRRLGKELALLWGIRARRYDLVINLTEGDRGAWAARVSGASVRVGVDERAVYTHVVKRGASLRHTVEKQLDALRRIGICPGAEERELVLPVLEQARAAVLRYVGGKRFVLVHPSSRWRFKCWPIAQMALCARRLIEQGEFLVFTSGPDVDEQQMVHEIVRQLPPELICNLAGKISLEELAALIECASALLCVDSVPFHMASALKAPVVALFGPTSEVTWGPWLNRSARVVSAPMSCRPCYQDGCGGSKMSDCLAQISVDQVLSELEVVAKIGSARLRVVDQLVDSAR